MDKVYRSRFAGSRVRRFAVLIAVLGGCTALLAQQQPPPSQPPTFRSGVELVTVDVGVVDRQGLPLRGLNTGDFTVTVAGQPRKVVSAEFVDSLAETSRGNLRRSSYDSLISTNEGAAVGRLFVFAVDQGTLEAGNVRHVGQAASRFLATLSFADRSALMLLPSGPNVNFTWAHDKVRDGLAKVIGQATHDSSWDFGSLSEAREISNRSVTALRTVAQRECGSSASAGAFDAFGSGGASSGGGQSSPAGGTPTGGQGAGGAGGGTGSGGAGSGTQSGASTGQRSTGSSNSCTRDVQMRAEWTWRGA